MTSRNVRCELQSMRGEGQLMRNLNPMHMVSACAWQQKKTNLCIRGVLECIKDLFQGNHLLGALVNCFPYNTIGL